MIPKSEHVMSEAPDGRKCAEQVVPDLGDVQTSTDIPYTTLPGCRLTKAQVEKVLEIAHTKKPGIPLYVAAMDKRNVNLKDSCVYIPLQLLLSHFKEEIAKATIQLEAPDNVIYSVGASKHSDDLIVIESGWSAFIASHHMQQKHLGVDVPHVKTISCFSLTFNIFSIHLLAGLLSERFLFSHFFIVHC